MVHSLRRSCAWMVAFAAVCFASLAHAVPAELGSWFLNTSGVTGYNGLPANVQTVSYSDSSVYVACSGIPAYGIGPWPGNPNVPVTQNWVFKVPRVPQVKSGTKTATPLGQIGVFVNGVPIYNPLDAMSYRNQNIWHQNAAYVEAASFDTCYGHPAPGGIYHHHIIPRCLFMFDSHQHSPVVGFAFDGYPVYGPYGYENSDGTGSFVRMTSSYHLRSISTRTTLPDGTVLPPSQYGPAVSTQYPLGYYVEDYEYVNGLGSLDRYNGRFAVTPEYPLGTYAYYLAIDQNGTAAYPYLLGPSYYGALAGGDTGPGGGHVTISEPVTVYVPTTGAGVAPGDGIFASRPFVTARGRRQATLTYALRAFTPVTVTVFDARGRARLTVRDRAQGSGPRTLALDGTTLARGVYVCRVDAGATRAIVRWVVAG